MLISDVLALGRYVSYISIDNKMRICQAANTFDISIENKTVICQAANTSDISIDNKT
jgi:hypothetical protein